MCSAEVSRESQPMAAQRRFLRGIRFQVDDHCVTRRMPESRLTLVSGESHGKGRSDISCPVATESTSTQNKPKDKTHLGERLSLALAYCVRPLSLLPKCKCGRLLLGKYF